MSKIPPAQLSEAIQAVLTNRKERKFKESIDLQVNLKNYDPQKDKRFSGSVRLPHVCRPRMTVCLLCDLVHEDIAKKNNVPTMNQEELKKLNKNKKLVKKMCNQYDAFLCSESIIKTVPRLVGPHMHRVGKFPTVCAMSESLPEKVLEIQSTVKFQLKKVLPASTIQILGAEKALFRALKKRKGNTPKYGLIFHSTFIQRAAKEHRGKISRYLANKAALACRIDCFMETPPAVFGEKLREQVEARLNFFDTGNRPPTNMVAMAEALEQYQKILRKRSKRQREAQAAAGSNGDDEVKQEVPKKKRARREEVQ